MTPFQITRSVRSLNRLRQVAQVLTRHGFGHIVTQVNLSRFVPVWMLRKKAGRAALGEELPSIGRRLALVCSELGPTFIKLGQMLSTRPDLVPEEVLAELQRLHDDVPPFDTSVAMEIITKELGRPITECFTWIDDKPVASASIGQVYRARLENEVEVMVKVRRPNIEDTITLDMQLLRWLADSLERLMPELRLYRPALLVNELEEMLTRELDYVNEASTTARFGEAMADVPGLRIPRIYWELSGSAVLTLEALRGTNVYTLLDAADRGDETKINRKLIARRLADCYLKQVFELGTFHADPHPGNLLVDPPADLALIDFGQVGTITDELMTQLMVIVYASVNHEIDVVVDAFADLGALGRDTDRSSLTRALQMLIDKYYGLPMSRLNLSTLTNEFADLVRRHDVAVPRDMLMLLKALGTVASVTTRLDPELDLVELLKPRIKKTLTDRFAPGHLTRGGVVWSWHLFNLARQAPAHLRDFFRSLKTGAWQLHVRHENADRLIQELDRSSNRLAFSIVIAAIIVGSSVVFSAGTEVTLFGFEARYVGIIGYLLAGFLGLGLSWAIFRSGRLH